MRLTIKEKQKNIQSTEEQKNLFNIYLKIIRSDPFRHDFFYIELTTGLRPGELCALRWEDYEQSKGTIRVSRTLGDSGDVVAVGDPKMDAGKRVIILPQSTAAVMAERLKKKYSPWIFPSPDDPENPVSKSSAYHRHKYFLRAAGLPDIRFHDLRHTFAAMAPEHGMDIKTLSAIIGHASFSTTVHINYSHTSDYLKVKAA